MWRHSCSKAELCFSVCELYSSETTTYTLSQRESLRFSLCVIFIVCFVISSTLFHRSCPQWCLPLWSVFCMIVSVTVSLSSSFAPVLQSHHLCVFVFSDFCNRLSVLIFFLWARVLFGRPGVRTRMQLSSDPVAGQRRATAMEMYVSRWWTCVCVMT